MRYKNIYDIKQTSIDFDSDLKKTQLLTMLFLTSSAHFLIIHPTFDEIF